MNKHYQRFLLAFFFSFTFISLLAQVEKPVHFSNGNFKTGNNIVQQSFKKENLQSGLYKNNYFVLLQFSSLPTIKQQLELKAAGIDLNAYLPGNAYFASIKNDFDFGLAKNYNITSINVIPADYKVEPALRNVHKSYDKLNTRYIAVSYHPSVDKKIIQEELKKAGATVVLTKFDRPDIIFIEVNPGIIDKIAALPFVSYISLQTIKNKILNYNDIGAEAVSGLNALGGKDLNGDGVTIGIGDDGDISTHIDLVGRTILRVPAPPDYHCTHVAGTMAGAGILDIRNHGLAPKATIVNQLYSDIITNAPTFITNNNMVVTNNSYYSVADGCPGEGEYDVLANYIDWQIKTYNQLLHVIAAGNDGSLSCSPYSTPFATVKSGWQTAKNVLTVGAAETQNYTLSYFSSCGPVQDGRIKPEITAGGWAILSTSINNGYILDWGTSMASPVATGALTLMYERYRQLHAGANPKSALMKAIICNTAQDLGNPGPDYSFGFGLINARRAVQAIDSNWYNIDSITTGVNTNSTFTLTKNARILKVMLYWADEAAAIDAATTLVNDLDLTVTEPSGTLHHPLILNPAPAHVNDNAVEGPDHTNNIEQVTIENPAAGVYTINVSGYSVPFGPQDYVVTYEVLDSSVTVEYPFGGETWVAGETENIRWTAFGSDSNSFTIQYSINNGNTWQLINSNVPAASQSYSWVVPSVITNQALIRITRNGTNLIGQSSFNFTILGRPVAVDTNVCQGYVQLNWGSINGATSYDVMQLTKDSMRAIANTTDTFFLVKNLSKDTSYWFGVRSKNGTVAGRRSLSVNVIPNGGACTSSIFNNDLIVDSILQPNTGRHFFANAVNAVQPVQIRIKNLGSVPVAGPFTVSYSSEGGAATETINTTLPANSTYNYTFATPYSIDTSGFHYNFKAWVTYAADPNHGNDTAYKADNLLANSLITSFPVNEGFETTDSATYTGSVLGLNNLDAFDFSASTANGRARSYIDSGFAYTGIMAMTLDQYPYASFNTTDSLTASYNLQGYDTSQLRYDFYYKNQGQEDLSGNKVWIRGNENSAWIQAYDLAANQAGLGLWQHGIFNINDVLNSAVPQQTVSPTFQVRFGEEGFASANTPFPLDSEDNGYTFDDLSLSRVFNDVAATQITSPGVIGCGLSATTPISMQIKNYNNFTINNVPVSYQVNGGNVITEIIPSVPSNSVFNYTFNQTADLSTYINYNIGVWVKYPGDTYSENDSILNYTLHNSPIINTYPYLQGFETDSGYFYTGGTNSSWQWGTPDKPIINKAANGTKAWVTNLTGDYNDNETSYLYSPCFDLSSLAHPMLSFSDIFQVELDYDFTWVEYSTDGITWQKLGSVGSGTNWYNCDSLQSWTGYDTTWHVASMSIPTNSNSVRFRFVLNSDEAVTYAGVGIDDVHIFDSASIYTGVPDTATAQNVSGNNWIDFTSPGGQKIVSINPNGINLGLTNVQVYPYSGPARYTYNQYYLNRNLVIQPFNPPTGDVSIRFYFTDAEADSLIKATGCLTCSIPTDAYELGVTKYSGSLTDENGSIYDDLTGIFLYIPRDSISIIPFNTGYYAQFNVHSFSEFWLNTGGYNSNTPLPLTLISFTATKQSSTSLLKWTTENEINTNKFIIQRSTDGGQSYSNIGYKLANDDTGTNLYAYTDSFPSMGINYYRLQIIGRDGTISYSQIQTVDFLSADDIYIYPDPITGSVISIFSGSNCDNEVLLDASGKLIRRYTVQGVAPELDITGVAKGVYELKIATDNGISIKRIIVQ